MLPKAQKGVVVGVPADEAAAAPKAPNGVLAAVPADEAAVLPKAPNGVLFETPADEDAALPNAPNERPPMPAAAAEALEDAAAPDPSVPD